MATFFRLAKRFIRFGVVGGSGVFVDMGVFFLLADPRLFMCDISLSKCIAAEVAIVNNFIWNDLWTFRDLTGNATGFYDRLSRFFKFNLICLAGIAISVSVLNFLVRKQHLNIYIANLVAIFIASVWNFLMNLKLAWKKNVEIAIVSNLREVSSQKK